MEKCGEIKPDVTPTERDADNQAAHVKSAADQILELDADFRKRAAEVVVRVKNTK